MKEHTKDYFEGILQIRNPNIEVLNYINDRIEADQKTKIAKQKRTKIGVDLYLTNQHYLQNLGQKLKQKFLGILKVSRRLHTVDKMTSKLLYRVTVMFRPLGIKRGETLMIHGEEAEILSVDNRARIKFVRTGEKKEVDLETIEKAIKYMPKVKKSE